MDHILSNTDQNNNNITQLISNPVEKLIDKNSTDSSEQFSNSSTTITNNNSSLGNNNTNDSRNYESSQQVIMNTQACVKQKTTPALAYIEAADLTEMNMVISALKKQFPHVNLHLCAQNEENLTENSNK